jgi:hypothetical protein
MITRSKESEDFSLPFCIHSTCDAMKSTLTYLEIAVSVSAAKENWSIFSFSATQFAKFVKGHLMDFFFRVLY